MRGDPWQHPTPHQHTPSNPWLERLQLSGGHFDSFGVSFDHQVKNNEMFVETFRQKFPGNFRSQRERT